MLYRETEVRAGIALLNEKSPNWREKINLDTLDLKRADLCVLGQVFGDYHRGGGQLGYPEPSYAYGFTLPAIDVDGMYLPVFSEERRARYNKLTDTWRTLIPETAPAPLNPKLASELAGILETANA